MTLNQIIDAHASFHLYQIQLEAKAANHQFGRMEMSALQEIGPRAVAFHNRSEGQKRRFKKQSSKV